MSKYAPGDKVRVVANDGHFFEIGTVATLVKRDPACDYKGEMAWVCFNDLEQTLLEDEFELVQKGN